MEQTTNREKIIYKVTWIGFGVNVLLTIGKLLCGFFGRSSAMIADGIHSLSDFVTDFIVLIFIKLSTKPKDVKHDYGHGKFETLASILIGLSLLGIAVGLIVQNGQRVARILHGEVVPRPSIICIVAAAVSIIAKECLFWYTLAAAQKLNAPAVKANAWHHRSDAFSSVAGLLGISGAYFLGERWRILDPIAALAVAALIIKVAYDLVIPGVNELLERSLPEKEEDDISSIIMQEPLFSDLHNLKTRRIGAYIAIEFHVRMPGEMSVLQSHAATQKTEQRLKKQFGDNTHVMIHIEPIEEK